MPGEITQRVRTIFGVNTTGALGGLGRMSRAARETRGAIMGARSALASLGVLGAGFGAGAFVKGIVKANSSLEQMRLQITNTIQQADKFGRGGLTGFNQAFAASAQVIERLRKEAIESPAGFQDMANAFNDVSMGLRGAGASYEQILKLTGNIGTLDKLSGGQGVVSRDVMQLLRGEIGGIQTSQLKAVRLELQKAYKKGDNRKLLDIITKATSVDPKLREALGNSLEGRWESMKDSIGEIARTLGGPLFKAASEELRRAYEWVTKHRAEVERVAKLWGDRIVKAIKAAWEVLKTVAGVVGTLAEAAADFNEALGGAPALVAAIGFAFTRLSRNPGFLVVAGALEAWRGLSGAQQAGGPAVEQTSARSSPLQMAQRAAKDWEFRRKELEKLKLEREFQYRRTGGRYGMSPDDSDIVNAIRRRETRIHVLGRSTASQIAQALSPGYLADYAMDLGKFGDTSSLTGGAEGANLHVDARGSTFRIENRISSDDPSRILSVSLLSAGQALVQRPLSARFGLGSVGLANGGGGG